MNSTHKDYVVFFSPGSFVAESSEREISEWSTAEAVRMAATITERYGAMPYGFRFEKRLAVEVEPGKFADVKQAPIAKSRMHYICCKVETLAQLQARADANERILVSNAESNGWKAIVTTTKGWRWSQPFQGDDVNVDADGLITDRAADYQ